jgi:hypothetical protein
MAMLTYTNTWAVVSVSDSSTPPIAPTWNQYNSNADSRAFSIIFGSSESELYVGGYKRRSNS